MIGALELGLIYGVMALGVYLTFRVLNFPDLTVDGSFTTGAATAAALITAGQSPVLATLAGAALGQTVLAKAITVAGFQWDASSAHSASYDAERSADIFCHITNRMHESYKEAELRALALGWHEAPSSETANEDPSMET